MIDISPRVQRLIVRSFPYLPFKAVYKKGTDIPVADALSHVTSMDPEDNIQLSIIAVNMITTWILMSVESQGSFSNKLDQLRKSTVQDEQLTRLKGYISTGFPCDKKNLPTDLHEFWPHKEMLYIESEENVVVEQPIAGTPVYRVQPVTGGNIRTLHRNLLLPLGVKLEPDYNSDDSILEEDDSSSDESTIPVDTKAKVCDRKRLVKKTQPQSEKDKHVEFDSNVDIFPDSNLRSSLTDSIVEKESVGKESNISLEDTSDKVIPEDVSYVSLPSQFLLPNLDDSSSDEETRITELNTEVELNGYDKGKEMQSINSEADSLVDTKELLEFIDTMDVGETGNVDQSVSIMEPEQILTGQDNIDPKSKSQFSSFMSYHEGELSSMDPSTNEQEFSKSPIEGSTQRHDSGVDNQGDISSHDSDMIAYEANETSSPSIEVSFPSDSVSKSGIKTEDNSVDPTMEVGSSSFEKIC